MASVLILGNGGREHAIGVELNASPEVKHIWVSNVNPGLTSLLKAQTYNINIQALKNDFSVLIDLCHKHRITMVVIGPERILAMGVVNALENAGIMAFGPTREAAVIETNKKFSKAFMIRHEIPTPAYYIFDSTTETSALRKASDFMKRSPTGFLGEGFVIKAAGLCDGKGVTVVGEEDDALAAFRKFAEQERPQGESILIEEKVVGYELSIQAVVDKKGNYVLLPACQDHKRRFAGETGVNTGGMGAICPYPLLREEDIQETAVTVIKRAIDGLIEEGLHFRGILYAGLIFTDTAFYVLEYNARFGDPEAQTIFPLLKTDLYLLMKAACEDRLIEFSLAIEKAFTCAICVVIKSYPDVPQMALGKRILGLDTLDGWENFWVYFSNARRKASHYITAGGRVLTIVYKGNTLPEATAEAKRGASEISFQSSQYPIYDADFRPDIGFATVGRCLAEVKHATYVDAGVDINAGKTMVKNLKKQIVKAGELDYIGGFGGVFSLSSKHYKEPILVAGVDGVGTKLMVAIEMKNHTTIGIDLVAMCVNDLLACGAEPIFFLDYYSTGKLDLDKTEEIFTGILKGCKLATCPLVGGETAELPGLYKNVGKDYDLGGFAIGAHEIDCDLPKLEEMNIGDYVIGFPSSGLHSNGYTLVRHLIRELNLDLHAAAPFDDSITLGDALLEPTLIYYDLLPILRSHLVVGAAHITGGGLEDNIGRILPGKLSVYINKPWKLHLVFLWLICTGICIKELVATLNMGIGFVVIARGKDLSGVERNSDQILDEFRSLLGDKQMNEYNPRVLGRLIAEVDSKVSFNEGIVFTEFLNNAAAMLAQHSNTIRSLRYTKKNVAVLFSGIGTNMQALVKSCRKWYSAGKITLVIGTVKKDKIAEKVPDKSITVKVIDPEDFPNKKAFEVTLDSTLREANIDYICLAGFMHILGKEFVSQWAGKILNIHPSLLPMFKGRNAQQQALDAGVKITGCTVHFVTEKVDDGKIIAQEAIEVLPNDDLSSLTDRIKQAEHILYPRVLQDLLRGEVSYV